VNNRLTKFIARFCNWNDITIRCATVDDVPCVSRMLYELHVESYNKPRHDVLKSIIGNVGVMITDASVLIAEDGGRPIGCICCSTVPPSMWDTRDAGSIWGLWVEPEHRDGKAASMLCSHAVTMLTSNGAKVIRITVDEGTPSELAYKSVGFRHVQTVKILEVD